MISTTQAIITLFCFAVTIVAWLIQDSGGFVGEVSTILFVFGVVASAACTCWLVLKLYDYYFLG